MISSTQKSSGPTVSYNDLEMAYSFASSSDDIEAAAYICRKTGNVYWDSSGLDDDVDVPDDVGDSSLFASVPGQRELDLGSQLVFRFIRRKLPVHYDRVSNMFHRRGAYRLYKDFLNSQGKLEEWYAFENSETESALRAWAEEEGFTVLPEVILEQPKRVYQFKVELEEIKPAIWRRIQVPENYNFWELHVAIQDAMGWLDYHLHVFRLSEKNGTTENVIGIPDDEFPTATPTLAGWETRIVDHFYEVGITAEYEYDFGDGWLHKVTLEGILLGDADSQYPLCIEGERACPAEDCGGVPGYYRLLDALSAPDNDEYKELMDWLGKDYDPDKFTPQEIEFDDPKARWESAFSR